MGKVSFHSDHIPITGPPREVTDEELIVDDIPLTFCGATIGNPHCVIVKDEISEEETRRLGPKIEIDPRFPNRTNVQFMKVLDRSNIQIEIWERGAGYTLASGSSGSASAAVAHRLGLCGPHIVVHMPGGTIDIKISEGFDVSMTGPVTKICDGTMDPDMFQ
jgi:diaminopimelate epimerase